MTPVVHHEVRSLRDRIDLIAQRINNSILYPQKRLDGSTYMTYDLARTIARGTAQHGKASELEPIYAVFDYVKANIEYRQDPSDYDLFMSVGRIINSGAGDCDEHVTIINALLASIGYRTGAKVISQDGNGWHIYSIVGVNPAFNGNPTDIICLDSAYGDEVGWQPDIKYRSNEYQCTFRQGKTVAWRKIR
jgi:hypothetical protein